jgi:hypothetical protein
MALDIGCINRNGVTGWIRIWSDFNPNGMIGHRSHPDRYGDHNSCFLS